MVLENVRSTKQPEENVLIDILEVREEKGRMEKAAGGRSLLAYSVVRSVWCEVSQAKLTSL